MPPTQGCHTRAGGYPVRSDRGYRNETPVEYWIAAFAAMTPDMCPRSRDALRPRFAGNFPPSPFRGRRECRMRAAPEVSCAMGRRSARMSIQGSGEHPASPAQWLYGLLRALPGEPCTVATVDANFGASGPHVFAVRFGAVRQGHLHVHRSPPRVRDDRERPSGRDGMAILCHISHF